MFPRCQLSNLGKHQRTMKRGHLRAAPSYQLMCRQVPLTRYPRWLDRQLAHSNIYCLFPRVPAVLSARLGNISHVLSCYCPPTSLAPIARGSDRCLLHSVRRFQAISQWMARVVREGQSAQQQAQKGLCILQPLSAPLGLPPTPPFLPSERGNGWALGGGEIP